MADENKKIQESQDGVPDNIDELLESAGQSLSELSGEVGDDANPSADDSNIELGSKEDAGDVDSVLESLAAELDHIGEDISNPEEETQDQGEPEDTLETADETQVEDIVESEASEPVESEPEAIADEEDDPLAQLTAELEAINGDALKDIDQVESAAEIEPEVEPEPEAEIETEPEAVEQPEVQEEPVAGNEDESVDDVLAKLAQEISESDIDEIVDENASTKEKDQSVVGETVSPVESEEAVEAPEGVDSVGDVEQNVENVEQAEVAEPVAEQEEEHVAEAVAALDEEDQVESVESVEDEPEEAVSDITEQPQAEAETAEQEDESEVIAGDLEEQIEALADVFAEDETETPAEEEPQAELAAEAPEAEELDISEQEAAAIEEKQGLPDAEAVLEDLDKQMKDLNEIVNDDEDKEPTFAAQVSAAEEDEAEDIVMQELAEQTAPKVEKQKTEQPQQVKEAKPAKAKRRGMNAAERAVASGLQTANKPFEKVVPAPAKDIVGLVAVITVAVCMTTLGLFLLFGGG